MVNTCAQITSDRRSKRARSNWALCIPFILSGSQNECWLHNMLLMSPAINRCLHSWNQFDERKQDRLVQKFGLQWLRRLDLIQAELSYSADRICIHQWLIEWCGKKAFEETQRRPVKGWWWLSISLLSLSDCYFVNFFFQPFVSLQLTMDSRDYQKLSQGIQVILKNYQRWDDFFVYGICFAVRHDLD